MINQVILCPFCSCENNHISSVELVGADDDYKIRGHLIAQATHEGEIQLTTHKGEDTHKYRLRGEISVKLYMFCENGCSWTREIAHHKGCVYVEDQKIENQ